MTKRTETVDPRLVGSVNVRAWQLHSGEWLALILVVQDDGSSLLVDEMVLEQKEDIQGVLAKVRGVMEEAGREAGVDGKVEMFTREDVPDHDA